MLQSILDARSSERGLTTQAALAAFRYLDQPKKAMAHRAAAKSGSIDFNPQGTRSRNSSAFRWTADMALGLPDFSC